MPAEENMSKIAIITDSTAYLPQELIQQYDIRIVPLALIFGEESFRDGVDLSPSEFYTRLQKTEVIPTTSQVTVGTFQKVFEQLHQDDREILVITISGKLSGTVESAKQAMQLVPDAQIAIVDSLSTTIELGLLVLATARVAANGAGLAECKQFAEQARERSALLFAVDTLEYLHRGGRIGSAKRLMGTVLNIKPILTVTEGSVEALDQVRTRKKSIRRLIDIATERVAGKSQLILAAAHANAPDDAKKLLEMASEQLNPVETLITELSPVIGTHVGPGTVALAYYYDES
jgi:DegV family protein with EDD domain